ncbi:MAG: hypothetical protein KH301_02120 [Brachyspira sp.]|nr:hypothetical protein [Brachyspira sp.]
MMKVACVSYRDWALKIYDEIAKLDNIETMIIRSEEDYNEDDIINFNPDMILFYGWSQIIKSSILKNFKCIMLHPAPLPKYRGGTPIQNQIIRGEIKSAVTLFLMDEGIDTGDIILQEEISFEGHLFDILDRMTTVGLKLTKKMLAGEYSLTPQDNANATYFKRISPKNNEITLEELQTKPAQYLYNKIRMLEDPYPNAYIKTSDGKKLLIKFAEICD